MTAESCFKLIGDKALIKRISHLRKNVRNKILRPAFAAGVRPVRDEAKQLVSVRSGAMKKAIRSQAKAGRKGVYAKVYVSKSITVDVDGKPYNPGAIAHIVEFGSKKAPAHPFLRPAANNKKHAFMQRATAVATRKLDEVVAEAKRKNRNIYK